MAILCLSLIIMRAMALRTMPSTDRRHAARCVHKRFAIEEVSVHQIWCVAQFVHNGVFCQAPRTIYRAREREREINKGTAVATATSIDFVRVLVDFRMLPQMPPMQLVQRVNSSVNWLWPHGQLAPHSKMSLHIPAKSAPLIPVLRAERLARAGLQDITSPERHTCDTHPLQQWISDHGRQGVQRLHVGQGLGSVQE